MPGGHVGAARMEREGAFWEVGTEYAKARMWAKTWECLGTTRSLAL